MKTSLMSGLAVAFIALPTFAAESDTTTLKALEACVAVTPDQERLACYDDVMKGRKGAASAVSVPTPAAVLKQAEEIAAQEVAKARAEAEAAKKRAKAAEARAEKIEAANRKAEEKRKKAKAEAKKGFGFAPKKDAATPDRIESTITKFVEKKYAGSILYLQNGQTWKLKEKPAPFAFKKGKKVIIRSGALGSYNLNLDGKRRIYKIERVK